MAGWCARSETADRRQDRRLWVGGNFVAVVLVAAAAAVAVAVETERKSEKAGRRAEV